MLDTLSLNNAGVWGEIGDDGVVVSVRGLLDAPRTRLTKLELAGVGMGDKGWAALASMVRTGRFGRLQEIDLGRSKTATDPGMCVLAKAIQEMGKRGLPMLSACRALSLERVTGVGLGALALALINNCPRLLRSFGFSVEREEGVEGIEQMLEGMMLAAGCQDRLKLHIC